MANIRLKYVTIDRSEGLVRYYLRLPGQPKVRLPGKLGDPTFMAAYQAAIDKVPVQRRPDGTTAKANAKGTLAWLVDEYFRSTNFKGLAPATQGARRNILKVVLKTAADVKIADITADVIRQGRDRRADTPAAAGTFLKAMRHLFAFAIEYQHATKNPALGIKAAATKSAGHHTWTDDEIGRFLKAYPIGTTAHLCLMIMVFTGLRVSDAAVLGRQHIRDGWITLKTKKTGAVVTLPLAPELKAAMDATKVSTKGHMHLLVNEWDKPFSVKGLGQRMRKWCDSIGLNHCSSHGLRKSSATSAADNGASENELMAIYGWTSAKQAAIYTKQANRRRLAGSGAAKITVGRSETGNEIVPPSDEVEVRRDNPPKKRKEINA